MSANLQWQCIRKSSCFILQKNGITFSTEPMNLANKNSFKFNGLVNKKAVGIESGPDGKGVTLVTRKQTNSRQFAVKKTVLVKNRRKTYHSIRKTLGTSRYRKDLIESAVRRASAHWASQQPKGKKALRKRGGKK